ncbi:MAG: hypothetical protein ACLU9S_05910 [Oscillospiraceae bacterium]
MWQMRSWSTPADGEINQTGGMDHVGTLDLAGYPARHRRAERIDVVARLSQYRDALFYAGREDYALTEGLDCKHLEALCDKSLAEANRILGDCTAKGIHVLTYQDAAYPNRLKHIPDPPHTLYYQRCSAGF